MATHEEDFFYLSWQLSKKIVGITLIVDKLSCRLAQSVERLNQGNIIKIDFS
jgi:hypothetical protein